MLLITFSLAMKCLLCMAKACLVLSVIAQVHDITCNENLQLLNNRWKLVHFTIVLLLQLLMESKLKSTIIFTSQACYFFNS